MEINPLILTPDGRVHALDAKVSLDDNGRLPPSGVGGLPGVQVLDPRRRLAQEKGLQYVGLQGTWASWPTGPGWP